MFDFQEVIVVGGAYPSYGCCSIEYCASELDPILISVSLTETMYSKRRVSPGQIINHFDCLVQLFLFLAA